jgi:hypothetical protein
MGVPRNLEGAWAKKYDYMELVVYPISPSIAFPSTHSVLDANLADTRSDKCKHVLIPFPNMFLLLMMVLLS